MDKYGAVSTIKINNIQYVIHKELLKNIPFFDDFIKNNNEEIHIQVDDDITPEIVNMLIDNLYGNKINIYHMDNLKMFNLFRLADYLCIDVTFKTLECDLFNTNYLKDTFNYAYDKKLIDDFIRYIDYFELDIPMNTFLDHMNFDLVTKIKRKYDINEMNELFNHNYFNFVVEIFRNNLLINVSCMGFLKTFFDNVIELLEKNNIEDNKVTVDFIVNNKDLKSKFSAYKYGEKYSKDGLKQKLAQDYCDEKVEIES